MKVSIIGGGGFIGSHLTEALVGRGHAVRIFDKDAEAANKLKSAFGVESIAGDFCSGDDLKSAVDGADAVVHLACTTIPSVSNADMVADIEKNLIGTVRLARHCIEAGTKRFVYASTGGAIYGRAEFLPIAETHPTNPISSYGIHKLAVEKYLALFEKQNRLDWVAIRAANPYGKKQPLNKGQGAVAVFADSIKKGKKITIWGDGEVVRDYIHISDLVGAYAAAVEKPAPSRIYNIGTSRGTSLNELIKILERASGKKAHVEYVESRAVDVSTNVLDCTLAKKELGWSAQVKLEDGVKEFFGEA